MLCRFLVGCSSKSCFLKSVIHSVLHLWYKKQLWLYVLGTFLHNPHRVRSSKWRRNEPSSFYFSSMVAVASITRQILVWKHQSMRWKSQSPPCFLPSNCGHANTHVLSWTDAASLHTCWRKNVSVNSYVTEPLTVQYRIWPRGVAVTPHDVSCLQAF